MSPTYRRHLRENLAQAGYADARIRREAIASAGRMVAELPALWFRPHAERGRAGARRSTASTPRSPRTRREGRSCSSRLIWAASRVAAQYAAARDADHRALPSAEDRLARAAHAGGPRAAQRAPRARRRLAACAPLLAALKRGEAVGFLPDQVPGEGEGEWAEFFGRPAYTMTLAARLAARDGVLCFFAYAKRLPRGAGYAMRLAPASAEACTKKVPTRAVNRALEALVRECPEQYLWGYNRYKTPRGARPQ